jgi:hypothetical protein
MDDPDKQALDRLLPFLGSCGQCWEEGFSQFECFDARPLRTPRAPYRPRDITGIVVSDCDLSNGNLEAGAIVSLVDGNWAALRVSSFKVPWTMTVPVVRGYVSGEFADVVFYGLDSWEREALGLPDDVDRALRWAKSVEKGDFTFESEALGMLGDPDIWRDVLAELEALAEEKRRPLIVPVPSRDITGVVAVSLERPVGDTPGWAAAVLKLRGGWGSIDVDLIPGSSEFVLRIRRTKVSSDLSAAAWFGITEARRVALGIPATADEFRDWAAFVERGYPATAHSHRLRPDR